MARCQILFTISQINIKFVFFCIWFISAQVSLECVKNLFLWTLSRVQQSCQIQKSTTVTTEEQSVQRSTRVAKIWYAYCSQKSAGKILVLKFKQEASTISSSKTKCSTPHLNQPLRPSFQPMQHKPSQEVAFQMSEQAPFGTRVEQF